MKRFRLSLLLTVLMSMVGIKALALEGTINGLKYNFHDDLYGENQAWVSGLVDKNTSSVVIPETVTYNGTTYIVRGISSYAFSNCTSLTSVDIPNTVTSINNNAFKDCSGLTSINIPNSVTLIEYLAFSGCSSLTSIYIPESVTSIYNSAFSGCSGMTSIEVAPDNTVYDSRDNCNAIIETASNTLIVGCQNTVIPQTVTSIGNSAFEGRSSLTSIYIPNSVTSIEKSAFYNCSNLTTIQVANDNTIYDSRNNCNAIIEIASNTLIVGCPNTVIPQTVTSIGNCAFYGCSGLTSIDIPNSVTSIGDGAFYGCSGLTSIDIPNSVTSIGQTAFYGCSGLTSVTLPNSLTSMSGYAFSGLGAEKVFINSNMTNPFPLYGNFFSGSQFVLIVPTGTKANYLASGWTLDVFSAILEAGSPSITFDDATVKTICIENWDFDDDGELSYEEAANVTSLGEIFKSKSIISFDELQYFVGLTSIDNTAFSGCSSLTSVTIGNSVTSIGAYAFSVCSSLTSVTIGNSVTSIGSNAFYGCSSLTSVTIPNSVTSIGGSAFIGCSSLTSIYIPESVTSICYPAFEKCSSLTSIEVAPDNTVYDSRDNCNAIIETASNTLIIGCQNTVVPNSVTSIGSYAFYGCSGLTSIYIPESVTSIYNSAFSGCSGLTSVTIGNSVTSIGDSAFSGCSGLTSVDIPNSVTSIGTNAFKNCSSLTSVTIGNSVTSIGYGAFNGCSSLTSVDIPNSVTSIGSSAFEGCSSLTSVDIPSSVTIIGKMAFANCSNLQSVTVRAETPLSFESGIYNSPFYNTSRDWLYVPIKSLSLYQNAYVWSGFQHIVGFGELEQSLAFASIPTMNYGDEAYTLPQTTDEGLALTWLVADATIATVNSNVLTITGAGTTTVTAVNSGENPYSPFSRTYTLTVDKAPLTITANSYKIQKGEAMPVFEATYEGFVNEDDEQVLTKQPEFTCTASDTETIGTYTITPANAAAQNYDISYVLGTLTINPVEYVHIAMKNDSGVGRTMIGYSSKYGLDFTNVTDVKAYIVMGYMKNMSDVLSVRVNIVPPYTGIVIKTDNPGVEVDVPVSVEEYYYGNLLKPVVESQTINPTETNANGDDFTNFIVGKLTNGDMGFVRVKNPVVRQNKCYLPVLSSFYNSSASARQSDGFGIVFVEGESNDVKSLLYDGSPSNGDYYDLQGRKVKPVGKGLYIHNGKKVFVK